MKRRLLISHLHLWTFLAPAWIPPLYDSLYHECSVALRDLTKWKASIRVTRLIYDGSSLISAVKRNLHNKCRRNICSCVWITKLNSSFVERFKDQSSTISESSLSLKTPIKCAKVEQNRNISRASRKFFINRIIIIVCTNWLVICRDWILVRMKLYKIRIMRCFFSKKTV